MPPANPAAAVRNLGLKAARRVLRVHKPFVRAARRAVRIGEQLEYRRQEMAVEREIAAIARSGVPIVVGPWLAEVGYEALYWIPFLRWFEDAYRVDPSRVIAVSRGGVDHWYAGIAERYVDVFDFFTPDEFAAANEARRSETESGGQKQSGLGSFDRDILQRVRARLGAPDAAVFHPALLFRLFNQFWLGNQSLDFLWTHTRFRTSPAPPAPALDLPADYAVAKFYTGIALPDGEVTRRAVRDMVRRIAARRPIVILDPGLSVDEHRDYLFDGLANVHSLRHALAPRVNLGVQTQVIAGARQFVGTCGSIAWLAPLLGVPTLAVYAEDKLLATHLMVARHAYRAAGAAAFVTLDLRASERLHLLGERV